MLGVFSCYTSVVKLFLSTLIALLLTGVSLPIPTGAMACSMKTTPSVCACCHQSPTTNLCCSTATPETVAADQHHVVSVVPVASVTVKVQVVHAFDIPESDHCKRLKPDLPSSRGRSPPVVA